MPWKTRRTVAGCGTAVSLVKTSAWFGLVAALSIWFVFAKEVYSLTGVTKR